MQSDAKLLLVVQWWPLLRGIKANKTGVTSSRSWRANACARTASTTPHVVGERDDSFKESLSPRRTSIRSVNNCDNDRRVNN